MTRNLGYLLAIGLIVVFPFVAPNSFYLHLAQIFAYTAIAVIGLNLLLGLSGQMSLGHGGFYALGAYGSALLATAFGWPIGFSILGGIALAVVSGILVGLICLRTRGLYLAMATLAFGFMVEIAAQRWTSVTGGAMGLFGIPQLDFGDFRMGADIFLLGDGGIVAVCADLERLHFLLTLRASAPGDQGKRIVCTHHRT